MRVQEGIRLCILVHSFSEHEDFQEHISRIVSINSVYYSALLASKQKNFNVHPTIRNLWKDIRICIIWLYSVILVTILAAYLSRHFVQSSLQMRKA